MSGEVVVLTKEVAVLAGMAAAAGRVAETRRAVRLSVEQPRPAEVRRPGRSTRVATMLAALQALAVKGLLAG
jgi:Ni,Fe-hydrogenase III small subunit